MSGAGREEEEGEGGAVEVGALAAGAAGPHPPS